MNRFFKTIRIRIPAKWRREDGAATMEFVLVVPIILMIFMASFESGLLMTRSIMLEQSTDMVMRELRLGHYPNPTNKTLATEICKRTIIFSDCERNIKIQMDRISTVNWNIPRVPTTCINRRSAIEPVLDMTPGQQNDLMLVRVCVMLPAMFPGSGIALNMTLNSDGEYGLISRTAFVTEPS